LTITAEQISMVYISLCLTDSPMPWTFITTRHIQQDTEQ